MTIGIFVEISSESLPLGCRRYPAKMPKCPSGRPWIECGSQGVPADLQRGADRVGDLTWECPPQWAGPFIRICARRASRQAQSRVDEALEMIDVECLGCGPTDVRERATGAAGVIQ